MCRVKQFDTQVVEAFRAGHITYQVYLTLGEEATSAAMSLAIPEFMIFAQHRCHGTYLSFGGNPGRLRDELLGLATGSSKGRAGSNCLQCFDTGVKMFGHHGLIGENVPIGVGAALGTKKPVVCFFGDGAAEEDYVFAAMGFAATHKLPVLFVCEDNNLSVLTPVADRRSWSMTKVAAALGMHSVELSDDPWTVYAKATQLKKTLPAFMNIFTCRAAWHVGIGTDGPPEWDRYNLVKKELAANGFDKKINEIELRVKQQMGKVWDEKLLLKLLNK
jgi:pyruvate dehydrogenase E1 component alpha subunit